MMRLLLDTHAFIWFSEDAKQIDERVKKVIEKPGNDIYLSIASVWEMAIKIQLGKLKIDKSIREVIDSAILNGFELLPILPEHIIKLTTLGFYHRDPFDRIIIAQGLCENLYLVSKDIVLMNMEYKESGSKTFG